MIFLLEQSVGLQVSMKFIFDGEDGFDKVESIYAHPTSTTTQTMTRLCLNAISVAVEEANK